MLADFVIRLAARASEFEMRGSTLGTKHRQQLALLTLFHTGSVFQSFVHGLNSFVRRVPVSATSLPPHGQVFEGHVTEGDPSTVGHVITTSGGVGSAKQTIRYVTERVVGNGSFGVVFQARCVETGETVAVKKVLQDKRFKNRELQIIRLMAHPNIVLLKHCFYTTSEKDDVFLNLVSLGLEAGGRCRLEGVDAQSRGAGLEFVWWTASQALPDMHGPVLVERKHVPLWAIAKMLAECTTGVAYRSSSEGSAL